MPSHRLAHLTFGQLDVQGYSVAGEETVVAVPQLDVCFDIGKAPDQFISINHVLLTHGHMDHAAGFAYYLSHRQFDGQTPGTVVAPKHMISPIQKILEAWGQLDGSPIGAELVGVAPGDDVPIKNNLVARVFATAHCHGSVGYSLLELRKKLKPEFRETPGPKLARLKRQGVEIEDRIEIPLVSYLGDTQPGRLATLDHVANSQILITECTFVEPDHWERARAGRHMHIQLLADFLSQMNNEHIVLIHTSQRTPMRDVKRRLRRHLPEALAAKTVLLMDRSARSASKHTQS